MVASLLVLHVVPPVLRPAEFVQDDSYFYLQIAGNIAAGAGSTFHGITPTNGYHPLWMGGAVAAAFLANGDKIAALHAVVGIQVLLAFATALLFARLARMMGLQYGLAGCAVVLSYLLGTSLYGSEAHVNALTLTAALIGVWRALCADRLRIWFTAGVLLGLAVLARLDNVFVAAMLGVLPILHDRGAGVARVIKRGAAGALGAALVTAPYLGYNLLEYGHLMPISGAIKSTFPSFDFEFTRLGKMGRLAAPFGLVALAIGQFLDSSSRRKVLWRGLGTGVLLHALYVGGFTDHYTFWAWYYVSGVVAAGLAVAYVPQWLAATLPAGRLAGAVRPLVIAAAAAMLVAGTARAWLKAFNPVQVGPVTVDLPVNEYRWSEEFALWMKAHLPADSAVLVTDWPGAIAYYSDRRVFPLDGLVNDFRYNEELLASGAAAYACAHGLRLVFGLVDPGQMRRQIPVESPLYRKPAGSLTLRPEDIVVRSRDVISRPDEAPDYALWRLDCGEL